MIPSTGGIFSLDTAHARTASEDFKLLADDRVISGRVDGIEAVRQAVFLMLNTERYRYPVYSWGYGVELDTLLGEPYDYVCAELERRIPECLLCDDRINAVDGFGFTRSGKDAVNVRFTVHTVYGSFDGSKEVRIE